MLSVQCYTVCCQSNESMYETYNSIDFAMLFGAISPDPPQLSVVQIEPMRCQAVMCGQFCLR